MRTRRLDRSLPGRPGLRRAVGPDVARPGPLCRFARLRQRSPAAEHLAVSRLGDRRLQPNLPYDQFTVEQIAGDLLPNADAGSAGGDRLPPQHDDQHRGRHRRRGVPRRRRQGPGRHDDAGLDGPDDGLRQVPQPQVRPDHAARSTTSSSRSSTRPPTPTRATKRRSSPRRRRSTSEQVQADRRADRRGSKTKLETPTARAGRRAGASGRSRCTSQPTWQPLDAGGDEIGRRGDARQRRTTARSWSAARIRQQDTYTIAAKTDLSRHHGPAAGDDSRSVAAGRRLGPFAERRLPADAISVDGSGRRHSRTTAATRPVRADRTARRAEDPVAGRGAGLRRRRTTSR